jgi:UDP-N-acetylglucosamine--N-acetylmuramyl-(pentapeptide) pyrophosphoryl-undecaprenol N-acetylglucosamine transferase
VLAMRAILRRFQPELVLGTGGYVSGPAVLAGHRAGIPTMIQEQNSIPGRMNRFLARFVDEIHVAYTESRIYFKQTSKIRLTGNPARIRQPRGSLLNLYRKLDLDPEKQTVLIVGGSRGARSINRAAVDMMPLLKSRTDLQFIIQTGTDDEALVQGAAKSSGARAAVRAYFTPIEEIYALATIVVCRAGAMTLAEIAQFGLPAILVPFPFAIYQHQLMNARILAGKGAAEVILDKDLNGKLLAEKIEALVSDKARRREMGLNAWNLARPDAHERLVNSIEALTHPEEKKGAVDYVDSEPMEAGSEGRSR